MHDVQFKKMQKKWCKFNDAGKSSVAVLVNTIIKMCGRRLARLTVAGHRLSRLMTHRARGIPERAGLPLTREDRYLDGQRWRWALEEALGIPKSGGEASGRPWRRRVTLRFRNNERAAVLRGDHGTEKGARLHKLKPHWTPHALVCLLALANS